MERRIVLALGGVLAATPAAGAPDAMTSGAMTVRPTPTAIARTLSEHFADIVSVADYGSKCDFEATLGGLAFARGGRTLTSKAHVFNEEDVGKLVFGSYESSPPPGLSRRTIVSVSGGVATVDAPWNSASRPTTTVGFGTDDTAAFARAFAVSQSGAHHGVEVRLPHGGCLIRTLPIADSQGLRIAGAGMDDTVLRVFGPGDGVAITVTKMAPLTASDFSIVKQAGANAGAAFAGRGLYVGNPDGDIGHVTLANVAVDSVYTGDGWLRNFEGENFSNAMWFHLVAVGTAAKPVAPGDIAAPGAGRAPVWGPTAAAGRGTSFYVHGSHGHYVIDSNFIGLVSIDNVSSMDVHDYQGIHLQGEHFINSLFDFRDFPSTAHGINELVSISGGLLQGYRRNVVIAAGDSVNIDNNLFWSYGSSRDWIGIWLAGVPQSTTITANKIVSIAGASGTPATLAYGVYDCLAGNYAHLVDANTFEYINGATGAGIATCPGTHGLSAVGNSFAGTARPFVDAGGDNDFLGSEANGTAAMTEDGQGGIRATRLLAAPRLAVGSVVAHRTVSFNEQIHASGALSTDGTAASASNLGPLASGLTRIDGRLTCVKGSTIALWSFDGLWGGTPYAAVPGHFKAVSGDGSAIPPGWRLSASALEGDPRGSGYPEIVLRGAPALTDCTASLHETNIE